MTEAGVVEKRVGRSAAALAMVLSMSCAPRASRDWIHPTPAQWHAATTTLERLRASAQRASYVAGVAMTLRDSRSGHTMDGRGAIAVASGRALRMILVGGAGVTTVDAWVTPSRWRLAVPPVALVRRGGFDDPPGLPIGFLRWWFFTPLRGRLSAAMPTGSGWLWLLRDGDTVVEVRLDVCLRGQRLAAVRRSRDGSERVDECHADAFAAPRAGDRVDYVDDRSGLRVELVLESVTGAAPTEEALRDPEPTGDGP
jgi:hypothetical protein